jgi:hypothetical protein
MSELPANYHSCVLLIFKSHKDCKEDNKQVEMDDYKKSILNPGTKYSDFVSR